MIDRTPDTEATVRPPAGRGSGRKVASEIIRCQARALLHRALRHAARRATTTVTRKAIGL